VDPYLQSVCAGALGVVNSLETPSLSLSSSLFAEVESGGAQAGSGVSVRTYLVVGAAGQRMRKGREAGEWGV
jgi:hypothetical protein